MSLRDLLEVAGLLNKKTYWVVYPCAQWRKEYPTMRPYHIFYSPRQAAECANAMDGFRVKIVARMK